MTREGDRLIDGQLIGSECTNHIRAKNGDGSQLLESSNTSDDGLVLGELLSADGEGDKQDSVHSDRNTVDEKDQGSVDATTVMVTETGVQAGGDIEDDKAEKPNLLQVTGVISS